MLTVGTSGHLTGISRKLKELDSRIKIIAVDVVGSILAQPESMNWESPKPFKVEGVGKDFIPRVCDR